MSPPHPNCRGLVPHVVAFIVEALIGTSITFSWTDFRFWQTPVEISTKIIGNNQFDSEANVLSDWLRFRWWYIFLNRSYRWQKHIHQSRKYIEKKKEGGYGLRPGKSVTYEKNELCFMPWKRKMSCQHIAHLFAHAIRLHSKYSLNDWCLLRSGIRWYRPQSVSLLGCWGSSETRLTACWLQMNLMEI